MYRVSAAALVFAAGGLLSAQIPIDAGTKATIVGSPAAIRASKENPEAVARGAQVYRREMRRLPWRDREGNQPGAGSGPVAAGARR